MISKLRSVRRPSPAIVVAISALVLALGGAAFAEIPDSDDGEIHGCYANRSGALRVIDAEAGESCTPRETGLNWDHDPQAYARVWPHDLFTCAGANGCLFAQSKNILSVRRESAGLYCIAPAPGVGLGDSVAAVTVDHTLTDPPTGDASAQYGLDASCGEGAPEVQVWTSRLSRTLVPAPGGGSVDVMGPPVPADDVGFTIVVP